MNEQEVKRLRRITLPIGEVEKKLKHAKRHLDNALSQGIQRDVEVAYQEIVYLLELIEKVKGHAEG